MKVLFELLIIFHDIGSGTGAHGGRVLPVHPVIF